MFKLSSTIRARAGLRFCEALTKIIFYFDIVIFLLINLLFGYECLKKVMSNQKKKRKGLQHEQVRIDVIAIYLALHLLFVDIPMIFIL